MTVHLLIGCSPETWPLIRCSSGCRRWDKRWKTKLSSSGPGTCQHTPNAATSPGLPQSWKVRQNILSDSCRGWLPVFPLEELSVKPAQPVSLKTTNLCHQLVFKCLNTLSIRSNSMENRKKMTQETGLLSYESS